jgi:carboxyl-terminal processing protease
MRLFTRVKPSLALLVAAAALSHGSIAAAQSSVLPEPGLRVTRAVEKAGARNMTMAAWGTSVWDAAREGDEKEVDRLLQLVDDGKVVDANPAVTDAVKAYTVNIQQREVDRDGEITKIRDEMDKLLAEEQTVTHVAKALGKAIELQFVMKDDNAVLQLDRVMMLRDRALTMARAAEAENRVLDATELFVLLDALNDVAGTYRNDVRRMAQRQEMLRLYVPQRLWELNNERRKARGDKELPAYNPVGGDYRERLAGVSREIILNSLQRSREHVDQIAVNQLLTAGLETLRVMYTTTDLQASLDFSGLKNEDLRRAMLDAITREQRNITQSPNQYDGFQIEAMLDRVLAANETSVRAPVAAMLHEFGVGAFAKLDEYSTIIWPDEVARFNRNTQGRFVGVGVQIEMDPDQRVKVVTPLEGTPAHRAGLHPGDIITKVDGKSIFGLSLDQVVDLITGREGTRVTLSVERSDDPVTPTDDAKDDEGYEAGKPETQYLEFALGRATIKVPSIKGWKRNGIREDSWDWFVDKEAQIGYVRLSQFADTSTDELDNAIRQMKQSGLKGLVFDLRFNPGGLLDQAGMIAQRFLPFDHEPIVSARKAGNVEETEWYTNAKRATLSDIPVVVLVNESSASASEIVSGAISVYSKSRDIDALVLGQRSFGKGSVQNVWPVANNAFLKLTTAHYILPDRSIIHKRPGKAVWGVEPNMHVEMLPDQISKASTLRRNADVLPINEMGIIQRQDQTPAPDPDELVSKGIDLQVEAAVLLLKARTAADAARVAGNP